MPYLCNIGIAGEKTPVDVSTVADVRVVGFGCGLLKNLLYKALSLIWLFEEELHHCCEDLQLCLDGVSLD